jgi:hypothetical protein
MTRYNLYIFRKEIWSRNNFWTIMNVDCNLAYFSYFEKYKEAYDITLLCVLPLSLLGNGFVNMFLRQRIHMEKYKNW